MSTEDKNNMLKQIEKLTREVARLSEAAGKNRPGTLNGRIDNQLPCSGRGRNNFRGRGNPRGIGSMRGRDNFRGRENLNSTNPGNFVPVAPESSSSWDPRVQRPVNNQCWSCGDIGHFARNCFQKSSTANHLSVEHTRATNNLISALYLSTYVGGERVTFLLDTGSSISLLNIDMYKSISRDNPEKYPLQESHVQFETVSGEVITSLGTVMLDLKVGNHIFSQKTIVADIPQTVMLGIDFFL